ncbi:23S rRNA (cytosine1962-C5)-methyltransferase [Neolewinella xylanilytica]|uniref:23S rRNA (Cytosine1962-C5)-methyltransferase n=1 Tax=Neolewinella xylanilytica TaxID=1514080 RepID=A0A2S6I2Y9_9BACT|nr:class I SAM-dependent rRNA methyltransferase [Neolewinella xylanilytica]PPK85439.1 23S rRNA (cytosine1962-C5)-methyltransferase [Neolewinella xylanilytica]
MPDHSPSRLATRLTPQGERILRAGHPWLFDGAVESVKGDGNPGDLAIIFDRKKDRCIGVGLYDPESPIRIRVLHAGGGIRIDEAFFAERLKAARKLRLPLLKLNTDGYRLVHGENDGFPGLIVDVYANVAVIKLYTPAWFPYLEILYPLVLRTAKVDTAVLRLARLVSPQADYRDGALLAGSLPEPEITFREHNLKFYANVLEGHKTGFFLDHRHNRKRVGELSEGQDVLDVFSYAGGFSVHALAGGAYRVVSLDISGPALEVARRNVALNFGEDPRHETVAGDAFQELEQIARRKEDFGIVVVDPPSFAKREKEVRGALDAYRRIHTLAVPLVRPGGVLVAASCSARVSADDFFATVERVLKKSGRTYRLLEKTFHDTDHPIGFLEGAYLKTGYYRLD